MTLTTLYTHFISPSSQHKRYTEPVAEIFRIKKSLLPLSAYDQEFLAKAASVVSKYLDDSDFNTELFADEMCMSRVHLYRKLKTLTGESVSGFVNMTRLKIAARLLKETDMSVKAIAYTLGFRDPKYFSRCFKRKIGYQPTVYAGRI